MIRIRSEKRRRMHDIVERMKQLYPSAECALKYGGDPWRLMVMGRLSAQCTDARVNEVSIPLFERYPTAYEMAEAELSELEEIIRPCGLFKMKAANIKDASAMMCERFGGRLPSSMDELLLLPGVGRKIANLLIGDVFGGEAVVCDTHCMRICGRLGMYKEGLADPNKIEVILRELIPAGEGSDFCHRIVFFGREVCTARSPRCSECGLRDLCHKYEREHGKDD